MLLVVSFWCASGGLLVWFLVGFWFALDLFRLIGFIAVDFRLLRFVGFKLGGLQIRGLLVVLLVNFW